jgi:hypothetical protein
MTLESTLPKPIAIFIRAVNDHDIEAFLSTFAADATVIDGSQYPGKNAIRAWSDEQIFGVNVTLQVVDVATRDGQTVVTFKVDGTFDRTGLPDPLLMNHYFTVEDDKIIGFRSRLAARDSSVPRAG